MKEDNLMWDYLFFMVIGFGLAMCLYVIVGGAYLFFEPPVCSPTCEF